MTKREKTLIYFAVLIVAVAVYAMVVLPYMSKTAHMLAETEGLQSEIAIQTTKLEQLPQLELQREEHYAKLDTMQHAFGDSQTQEAIATYFGNTAESTGLKVIAFSQIRTNSLLDSRGLSLFPMAEVTLTCQGDSASFMTLVDTLNKRADITVLSLHYTKPETEPQEYTITCLLLMNPEEIA